MHIRTPLMRPTIPREYAGEFFAQKFFHNNLRVCILASFLTLEQLIYGLVVRVPGSTLQHIHFYTALVMGGYACAGFFFTRRKPKEVQLLHFLYVLSFGICGMSIALIRIVYMETAVFRLPTIYIAVLYGFAVIFFFNQWQSLSLYVLLSTSTILLIPSFYPAVQTSSFVADVVSNGFIAWLVSWMNYRNFVVRFLDKKEIQAINEKLHAKNRQIQKVNRELKEMSIRDGLTGLYNRRKLDEEMSDVYRKALRYGSGFSVIIIDVDHFKYINDNYGHDTGDAVLREMAGLLERNIRDVDICGRWGGEEFLVICPRTDLQYAVYAAERLRTTIAEYEFLKAHTVTASFGIAAHYADSTPELMLKQADSMLYRAKTAGRNRVEYEAYVYDIGPRGE